MERIIAAACKHPDGSIYSLLPPARHGQVLRLVEACYAQDDPEAAHKCQQGFVTSENRFVDRILARSIAVLADQSSTRDQHFDELYSEDLW